MSDKTLIDYTDEAVLARQNIAPNAACDIDGEFYDIRNLVFLARTQADRIEVLIAERDEAWKRAAHAEKMWGEAEVKLATCKKYRDAYAEFDRIATQAVRDLEAKLAKANDRIQGLKELLWAAEKDANDAEAYAGELEAKLAKAMELANLVVEFSDRALWKVVKEVVLELKGEK